MALWIQFRKNKHSSNTPLSTVYKFITFTVKKITWCNIFPAYFALFCPYNRSLDMLPEIHYSLLFVSVSSFTITPLIKKSLSLESFRLKWHVNIHFFSLQNRIKEYGGLEGIHQDDTVPLRALQKTPQGSHPEPECIIKIN